MNKAITLDEYLSGQSKGHFNPYVKLTERDYWMGEFVTHNNREYATVKIYDLNSTYVVVKGSTTLYTMDNFGLPKQCSCFHLSFVPL